MDKGPLGGTCLTVGCIPSKILIFPADRIIEIQEVINAMTTEGTVRPLINRMHIHPAMPEVIQTIIQNLQQPQ